MLAANFNAPQLWLHHFYQNTQKGALWSASYLQRVQVVQGFLPPAMVPHGRQHGLRGLPRGGQNLHGLRRSPVQQVACRAHVGAAGSTLALNRDMTDAICVILVVCESVSQLEVPKIAPRWFPGTFDDFQWIWIGQSQELREMKGYQTDLIIIIAAVFTGLTEAAASSTLQRAENQPNPKSN